MKPVVLGLLTTVLVLSITNGAWAHRYIPNRGTHTDPANAIPIGDIDVSQVVYHTVTEETPSIWLSFEAKAGVEAKIQIGVPYIERYKDYRPAFALLGENMMPLECLPFDLPEGYGGIVFTTDAIAEPELFHEEFTGTESWVFQMQTIVLPADGRYYIVGFVPSGEDGKFWVAPGTAEKFGFKDIVTLPWVIYKVRTFHEIFPFGGILAWGMFALLSLIGLLLF